MKKICLIIGLLCGFALPVYAQESPTVADATDSSELYDGADIKPIERQISDTEKMQETGSDLNYIGNETPRPDLLCADDTLLQRVKDFIYEVEKQKNVVSVPQKRERVLLVENLHPFKEVGEDKVKGNFEAAATLTYLRINGRHEIHRICVSPDNHSKKFKDVYIIIYPYLQHYKVTVTNLVLVPENADDATFIYKMQDQNEQ